MSAVGESLTVTSALKGTNIKVRSNEALTKSVICSIISSESNSSDAYPSATLRGADTETKILVSQVTGGMLDRARHQQHMGLDCSTPEDEFKSYQFISVELQVA